MCTLHITHLWTHINTPPTYYIPTRCSSEARRTNAVHSSSIADTGTTTTVHSHTRINLHCTVLSSIPRSTVAHVLLFTHCCTRSTVLAGLEHHTGSDWCLTVTGLYLYVHHVIEFGIPWLWTPVMYTSWSSKGCVSSDVSCEPGCVNGHSVIHWDCRDEQNNTVYF